MNAVKMHSKHNPCPVCKGHPEMPRGKGVRCWGARFGEIYASCSRVGSPWENSMGLYRHVIRVSREKCPCGLT